MKVLEKILSTMIFAVIMTAVFGLLLVGVISDAVMKKPKERRYGDHSPL